ncbi:nitrile hydratase subunit beta [Thalassospiraceae bacterium LMO-SO8]|nr:nitrile hydratase subunit beta [Thalassospiraceae bacterium LMO-SO8]
MARADGTAAPPGKPLDIGAAVRVAARFPDKGHVRTPYYLRGKRGRVVRYFGVFLDPTALAVGAERPEACRLYQVQFEYDEVWGPALSEPSGNTMIVADLFDQWLEEMT